MFGQQVKATVCAESEAPLIGEEPAPVYAVTREDTHVAFCLHGVVVKNIPVGLRRYGGAVSGAEDGLSIHRAVSHGDGETYDVDDLAFTISNETALEHLPIVSKDFGIVA